MRHIGFYVGLLTSAFQPVIDDNGFKNSAIAINAQQLTQDVKTWSSDNQDKFEEFAKVLTIGNRESLYWDSGYKKEHY